MVGANVNAGAEIRALRCRHGEDLLQAASTEALTRLPRIPFYLPLASSP